MPQWTAEHAVSRELAAELLEEQFPELFESSESSLTQVEWFGEGWDNVAFCVNEKFVFRFPRRKLGVECMEWEIQITPHFADLLPTPITAARFLGKPSPAFPWPFAGYRKLDGQTACRADLNDAQRIALAAPLAEFLSALHSIDAEQALAWGAPTDVIGRLNREHRLRQGIEYYHELQQLGAIPDAGPWIEALCQAAETRDPQARCLTHGDLYSRHLLTDGTTLTGVIDWGDVHVGDPAVDLAIVWSFLPPEGRRIFEEIYGAIDEPTAQLARMRALNHTAIVAVYSYRENEQALLRESLSALNRLRFA